MDIHEEGEFSQSSTINRKNLIFSIDLISNILILLKNFLIV